MHKFYFSFCISLVFGLMLNAQSLIIDLEPNGSGNPDCLHQPSGPGDPNAPVVTLEPNPDVTGINTTANCIKFVETNGAFAFNRLQIAFDGTTETTGFTLGAEPVMRFMIYSENQTSFDLNLELSNGAGPVEQMELQKTITVALNTWTLVEYDFTGEANINEFIPNVRLHFTPTTGGTGDVYYVDEFIKAATAILPVEIVGFTGIQEKNVVNLNWQTASEINNEGFDIEHATDGRNFTKIEFINGYGTTNDYQNYSFAHNTPAVGKNYYRLKQMDYDGAFDYSKVVIIDLRKTDGNLSVHPTLVNDFMQVNFVSQQTATATIQDQTGRPILQQTIAANAGSARLNTSNLPQGLYFLTVVSEGRRESVRFVKQ